VEIFLKKDPAGNMGMTRALLLLSSISTNMCYVAPQTKEDCSTVRCRPGRQCLESPPGLVQCVCAPSCPDHWKPVCGSDGVSYDNHCLLHRAACLQEIHISPIHEGFCSGDREALIARQEFIQQLALWDDEEASTSTSTTTTTITSQATVPLPDACFQNDRDRLREFIINWFQIIGKKQKWHRPGMAWEEELREHFNAIDGLPLPDAGQKGSVKGDSALDSGEILSYLSRNKTIGARALKMRQLCLDALVEEGDLDFDWRLSFSEFSHLLAPDYIPSRAICRLRGKSFDDGAETRVECNGCVCACGKWVCTSEMCPQGYRRDIGKEGDDDDDEEKEDEDDEAPEDDPDVQDIRWF